MTTVRLLRLTSGLFLIGVFILFGCINPDDGPRTRSQPTGPDEVREKARSPGSRSNNPDHWHVRVELTSAELDERTRTEAGINWSVSGGGLSASGGSPPLSANGLRVGVSGPDVNLRMFIGRSKRTTRTSTSQFITTLNNHPATLSLRRQRTQQLPGQIVVYGHGGQSVLNRYTTQVTGFQLRVTPEIVDRGPYVRLRLTPIMVHPEKGGVSVRELETTVRVRSGQSVLLASTDSSRQTIGHALFSERELQSRRDFAWIVTPEIIK